MRNVPRHVWATVIAVVLAMVLLFTYAVTSDGHWVSDEQGRQRIFHTNMNGLCGAGTFICYRATMKARRLYNASNHWKVYEASWHEIKPWLGPWATRKCYVSKIWVQHEGAVGSPTKADYCWK